MSISDRLYFFDSKYEIKAEYFLGKGERKLIGSEKKICRFCQKKEPEVTFRNVAHAVPEFLGNKQLILRNECDQCNTFVSNKLENHLDKYTKPYRTAGQIKGKKKIPTYKTKDKKSRFEFRGNEGGVIETLENGNFLELRESENTLVMNVHLEPFIPIAVYKCLIKIALSIVDEDELENLSQIKSWIFEESHRVLYSPLPLLRTFIPGPRPNHKLIVLLLKRKRKRSHVNPHYYLVLGFGNLVYQIAVPSDNDIKVGKQRISYVRFPLPFEESWQYGALSYDIEDMVDCETINDKKFPINYSYEQMCKQG